MYTFQDFENAQSKTDFIRQAIQKHRSSAEYATALDADEYEAQRNTTINRWTRFLFAQDGRKVQDFTAANNRIASNFFHRLNTQRAAYSLGNGVSFASKKTVDGKQVDATKQRLGADFDTRIYDTGYKGLIHGLSFIMWNLDRTEVFSLTEFVPLWDEYTGNLRAGIRFWSMDWGKKPVTAVLYEEDGYTKYQTRDGSKGLDLVEVEKKRTYKQKIRKSTAEGEQQIGGENYTALPIVPFWGSKHKQSTLVGMKASIDSYDLIRSGFANDLEECAEIFWIVGNASGESDESLARFRDRIKLQHIAAVDEANSSVTPYTQNIPHEARKVFLDDIRSQIYEDFGGLDVHTISAGSTNDHIDAAYQPLEEEADDFEYQLIKCIRQLLSIIGIDDMPVFKRNRISNQKEMTETIISAANYLDDQTILNKLPFITVDEVEEILARRDQTLDQRLEA